MTREEAIALLRGDAFKVCAVDLCEQSCEDCYEALYMAIEALQTEGVGRYEKAMEKLREMPRYLSGVKEKQIKKIPSEVVEVVWCKECRHASECHKSVQYTRNGLSTVTIGYSPIEWCSRGERR